MKTLGSSRHGILERKYAVVCAFILVVGALTMAALTSIPALAFYPSRFLEKTAVSGQGLITHIHISDNVLARGADEAMEIEEVKIAHNPDMSASMEEIAHNPDMSASMEEEESNQRSAQEVLADGIFDGGSVKDGAYNGSSSFSEQKGGCSRRKAALKVFMYDLPPEFHFGMIAPTSVEHGATWPADLTSVVSYPGGLTEQHSVEYWLTLDLLNNSEEEDDDDDDDDDDDEEEEQEQDGRESRPAMESFNPEVTGYLNKEKPYPEVTGYLNKEKPYPVSPQHRLTVRRGRACVAIRVKEARDADVFFVPFFASLSYNKYSRLMMGEKDIELQKKVVNFVTKQDAWKRSNGRDHVIVMHHPNSLYVARNSLHGATFVVADFGRFSSKVAHFGKDVVAPYKHVIPSFHADNTSFLSRTTLLFFQGVIIRKEGGAIRKKLYSLLKNEKGVVFKDGIAGPEGIDSATEGMRSSKFCLHLAGDTPSSNRLFDAIVSHCVPVVISEDIELPYEHVLDYSKFCVFVTAQQALRKGFLLRLLRRIGLEEWTSMWTRLRDVRERFEYRFPSLADDAVQMIWKSVAYKLPSIRQDLHKSGRYSRSVSYKMKNSSF